jgi:hypothetical protein
VFRRVEPTTDDELFRKPVCNNIGGFLLIFVMVFHAADLSWKV